MMASLQKNLLFCFVVDNIQQIISNEIKPFKEEIEDNSVSIDPILESIRQKIVLYLNDLFVKNTLKSIPSFTVIYNEDKTVYFHFMVPEFCTAVGVDGMYTPDGDMIH